MEFLNGILNSTNDFMYGSFLIILLVGSGLYFSFKTKFCQFTMIPEAFRVILESNEKGSVSSFQALMISTASRVGTGNIAGVATAIATGGAGAVFWMWIMALIGSASAFIESTLAQVYKVKDGSAFRGGPAYYIEKAMKKRWLGIIFAILLIVCFAYGFNGLQAYTISSAFEYYVGPDFINSSYPLIIGIVLAILTAIVIFGGVHRISFVTTFIVPIMAIIYLGLGLFIMVKNITLLPSVVQLILSEAMDFKAFAGGFAGSCVVIGIKRGLFSNEAGMGSAPNAAAAANVSHPAKQGLVQVISVFIDTLLICSTTSFILLLSGVSTESGLTALPYVQQAVYSQIGEVGIHFVTFSIFAFAFSSIVGNYYYAQSNLLFISESKLLLLLFRLSVITMIIVGAVSSLDFVWNLADVFMGLMATLNIFVILFLGNTAIKVLNDYKEQKKQGKDPVFNPTKLGIKDTQAWD